MILIFMVGLFFSPLIFLFIMFMKQMIIPIILSILTIVIVLLFGEKLLLVASKARRSAKVEKRLQGIVNNYSTRLGVNSIDVLISYKNNNNLIIIDSFNSSPSYLVIGSNVLKILSQAEIKALLWEAVLKIKTNESKILMVLSLIFVPYKLVVYIFELLSKIRVIGYPFKLVHLLVFLLFLPIFYFERFIIRVVKDDSKDSSYNSLNDSINLVSAKNKLESQVERDDLSIFFILSRNLMIFNSKRRGIITTILERNPFKEQQASLNS